jgi:hypothetical protein
MHLCKTFLAMRAMANVRNQISIIVLIRCERIVDPERLTGIVAVIPWRTLPGLLGICPIDFTRYDPYFA